MVTNLKFVLPLARLCRLLVPSRKIATNLRHISSFILVVQLDIRNDQTEFVLTLTDPKLWKIDVFLKTTSFFFRFLVLCFHVSDEPQPSAATDPVNNRERATDGKFLL